MKKQNVRYDKETDAMYIALRAGKEASFDEIEPNIVVEYNLKGQPLGIEILSASRTLMRKIKVQKLHRDEKNTILKSSTK